MHIFILNETGINIDCMLLVAAWNHDEHKKIEYGFRFPVIKYIENSTEYRVHVHVHIVISK